MDIPWKRMVGATALVAIIVVAIGQALELILQIDPGGPFSSVFAGINAAGAAALLLLGGGLLIAIDWLFDLPLGGGF